MAYSKREGHTIPSNPNQMIWRYMDLAKFYSLLHVSSLHFARIDQMPDKFEGVTPIGTREQIFELFETLHRGNPSMREKVNRLPHVMGEPLAEMTRQSAFINCWHANDAESGAMWKIYGEGSVAIQSTFQRLVASLEEERDREVNIGLVEYINPLTWRPEKTYMPAVLQKRPLYDFERELRAIVYDLSQPEPGEEKPTGIRIRVSLPAMIEHVYIGPDKGQWYVDIIRNMLDAHGLNAVSIIRSSMNESPIYG